MTKRNLGVYIHRDSSTKMVLYKNQLNCNGGQVQTHVAHTRTKSGRGEGIVSVYA